MPTYRFIDLFAGIGGFHLALHNAGCECVYACEIDSFARTTYEHNFKNISPNLFSNRHFAKDILSIDPTTLPEYDILCAGFPCQSFSQAGFKRGFQECNQDRGNMFFVLRDIIKATRPKVIFLENVRHLLNHDNGSTFEIIKHTIENELKYNLYYQIVRASDHGLPQHRPRLYMVGFRQEDSNMDSFTFPVATPLFMTMDDVWGGKCNKKIGFTLRVGGKGSRIDDRHNWDSYLVDGHERRLGIEQGKRMMGLPIWFEFPVSHAQAMKQLGNSVAVSAIEAVARQIVTYVQSNDAFHIRSIAV